MPNKRNENSRISFLFKLLSRIIGTSFRVALPIKFLIFHFLRTHQLFTSSNSVVRGKRFAGRKVFKTNKTVNLCNSNAADALPLPLASIIPIYVMRPDMWTSFIPPPSARLLRDYKNDAKDSSRGEIHTGKTK